MKKWVVNGCAYYEDVTDINVGSIEQNIKILYKLVTTKFNNDYSIDNVDKEAIENLLLDYTRQKQINEEHQKINGELSEKVKKLEEIVSDYQRMYCRSINDGISKQKIKAKIEKIFDVKIHNYNYLADTDWNYSQEQVDRQIASILKRILDEVLDELLQGSEE